MSRVYFNEQAHHWDATVMERDDAKLQKLTGRLGITPGSSILDVGTGTGVLVSFLLKAAGVEGRVLAIDFAEDMVKSARAKQFSGNVDFLCADALSLPVKEAMFDAVVCYSSFPHFKDKASALREFHRVIAPGGRLAICHTKSRSQINQVHSRIPALVNDLLPDEAVLREMLYKAGFTNCSVEDLSDSYLCLATRK